MKILEHRALRGPNRYSRYPTILLLLDIGDLEARPTDCLPGFSDRLIELMPSLHEHRCSEGRPGGFIERLRRGTWSGHVVEHVALELQCLAGMEVGFGKTHDTSQAGVYEVVYRYRVESAGLRAGEAAVALVEAMIEARPFDLAATIAQLAELRESEMLGPSTRSIVDEARRRGIATLRLDTESSVQLGYGARQRRIQATMTDRTSALGVEIADQKQTTKRLLQQSGIPTPDGSVVTTFEEAVRAADRIGYPVAVKPTIGNHGRGITACVDNVDGLESAFVSAQRIHDSVIVERSLTGFDFRLLVIDGRLCAAALREPAHVIGDGASSIRQLIEQVNADPRRGAGHERVLTAITVDHMTERLLSTRGYDLDAVAPEGERIALKSTANLSTGGTARDVTDEVHQDVRLMCERIARLVGLDCIGIDIVAPSLDGPLDPTRAGVVEVNAAPGFRMHLDPTEGLARDVARPFVEMLFPVDVDFATPIIAVTGTNGKTTTAKMIAHSLKYSGKIVGLAGTTGVEIDGVAIVSGDHSGPEGAGMVLREPTIDHAVLEVARGGILRRGLGFEQCDVGIMLNVDADHLGIDGVDSVEDLAAVKSVVLEAVRENGASVLNADDPYVVAQSSRAAGRIVYFSIEEENAIVREHLAAGGCAVVLQNGVVVIRSAEPPIHVLQVIEAPITLRGIATFNTVNVLAAVAALHSLGLPVPRIRSGVTTFHPSATQNPGRMNVIDFVNYKVVLDYAHNVPAVRALGRSLPQLTAGRKIVVAHGTGNRRAESIEEFGAALVPVYDHVLVTDVDPRDRPLGETANLVRQGALRAGLPDDRIELVLDPMDAVDRAFALVRGGDLIVVQVDEVRPMLERVMWHFDRQSSPGVAPPRPALQIEQTLVDLNT